MAKLPDFIINDFSGGLVRNKSDYQMNRNEFKDTLNLDIDERGRAIRRRGIQLWGTPVSGSFSGSTAFVRQTLGGFPYVHHLLFTKGTNAAAYAIFTTRLNLSCSPADSTISVSSTDGFANSGTIEINGDIISYTGKTNSTFTGCSGIIKTHLNGSPVNQISLKTANIGVDTTSGVYFAVLNNQLFINGRQGSVIFDGTGFTAISDTDEPAGLFSTNYRDRIYVAGSGVADGSGTRNGDPRRVSFSEAGDPTNWNIDDYFDVEDDLGEPITGLSANDDYLFIFKTNSIFTYNELQLQQQLWGVGAYNHYVIQRIGKLIYTFCPTGVWETNGFQARLISEPIKEYLKEYIPSYDVNGRTITDCFATAFDNKYILYLTSISKPYPLGGVALIFDTIKRNWTIHDNYGNGIVGSFLFLNKLAHYGTGYVPLVSYPASNQKEAVFAGSLSNGTFRYWRLYENYLTTASLMGVKSQGDIYPNLIADNNGYPISTILETPFLDIGNSLFWKNFGFIRILSETGSWNVSYRLDKGDHITDWISLGEFNYPNQRKRLLENNNEGFRIAIKITSNSRDWTNILNGIIIENIEAKSKQERRVND